MRSITVGSAILAALLAVSPGAGADEDAGSAGGATTVSAADFAGTWAQLRVLTAVVDIPVLGRVKVTTTAVIRMAMSGSGRNLEISGQACSIEQEMDTSLLRSVFPEGLARHAGRFESTASLRVEDGEIRFFQPRRWLIFGARLDDPEHEELPTDPDDERVVDSDRDGKPGVTVHFEGLASGDVYLVQRQWSTMRGVADGDRIDGSIQWGEERSVLDATSVLLKTSPPSRPDSDPSSSYFRMTRVGEDDDCAAILAERDTLFAR